MQDAFPEIDLLAAQCQFRDCRHMLEKNCAVKAAVEAGELPRERYESYLKLRQEIERLEQAQTKRGYLEKKRQAKIANRALDEFMRVRNRE